MRTVWHSLLWKEWREYRWKIAALTLAILLPLLVYTTWTTEGQASELPAFMLAILSWYGILAGCFLGMGGAAKENGAGTAAFLQSLPMPQWKVASVKLLMISLVAAAPIALFVLMSYLCYRTEYYYLDVLGSFTSEASPDLEPTRVVAWFARCGTVAVLGTVSILWWMAAIGVNRSDEISAGAIGFLGVAVIWCALVYLFYLADRYDWSMFEDTLSVAASAAPGGPAIWQLSQNAQSRIPLLNRSLPMACLIGHVGVAAWFLFRFGRSSQKTGRGENLSHTPAVAGGLKAPRKSQLRAVAWKQMRETGPLALVTLAAVLAISAAAYLATEEQRESFPEILLGVGVGMTFLVVVVAGIGLYLDDLKPELAHFWRSRPTHMGLWFAAKYVSGMLTIAAVLGIPIFVAGAATNWNQWEEPRAMDLVFGGFFVVWFFVMAYSLAMTSHCLLRQPIYAAVFTVLAIWLGSAAFAWIFRQPHWTLVVSAMLLSLAATITLGWLAVRNDWGWKR